MIKVFTVLVDAFDKVVVGTITHGSAAVISVITPLLMTCFSIYLLLLCVSYWNGGSGLPLGDTIRRVLAWCAITAFGLNIELYTTYVVPFFNGFGDDIAAALVSGRSESAAGSGAGAGAAGASAMALDSLLNAYLRGIVQVWEGIPANPMVAIVAALEALLLTLVILVGGTAFLALAAAYIIMARFALSLLLALGPLFFACALFPATRKFFDAWVGQCLNYGFLTALYAAVAAIQVRFAVDAMPGSGSALARSMYGDDSPLVAGGMGLVSVVALAAIFAVFFVIGTNLPSLASQLAGGMGISGLVGSGGLAGGAAKTAAGASKFAKSKLGGRGGSMAPESVGNQGGQS